MKRTAIKLWYVPWLLIIFFLDNYCAKIVRVRSYSGMYFSAFGLNTDSPYLVRMRENAIKNNFEYGHFLRIELLTTIINVLLQNEELRKGAVFNDLRNFHKISQFSKQNIYYKVKKRIQNKQHENILLSTLWFTLTIKVHFVLIGRHINRYTFYLNNFEIFLLVLNSLTKYLNKVKISRKIGYDQKTLIFSVV